MNGMEICNGVSYIRTIVVVRHSRIFERAFVVLEKRQHGNLLLSRLVTSSTAHTLSRSALSRALTFALALALYPFRNATFCFHHYY